MGFMNFIKEKIGRLGKADHSASGHSEKVSTVVHVDQDQCCFISAVDEYMKGQITEAAGLNPAVEILGEGEGRLVAAVPWAWIRIEVPNGPELSPSFGQFHQNR